MAENKKFRRDEWERAISAHYKTEGARYHSESNSEIIVRNGLDYIVIRDSIEVLSVFRVRNDGSLRRLKRWPKEFDEEYILPTAAATAV